MKTIDIEKLSQEEKLELMEAIWENLSKTEVSAPAWHEQALKETEERVSKGLEQPVDWKEAKNQLRNRFA
ncbi:addiction module protein [Pontiellaceae bacterium B1224]|nr:addiction module protein [Pontiellaceae bacterium B1224]